MLIIELLGAWVPAADKAALTAFDRGQKAVHAEEDDPPILGLNRTVLRHSKRHNPYHNRAMPLPNSLPWMESVDAKMIRAHEHLEAFARELDEYLSTIRLQMYLKSAAGQSHPWLVVHANDYTPPIRLSAIAGDCIHNMRSALDNLVCGLALIADPACRCKDTKFPFTENETDWTANSQGHLPGVPNKRARSYGSFSLGPIL